MKQILSIADFALILNMVNERIANMEHNADTGFFKYNMDDEVFEEEKQKRLQELQENAYYKQLVHLRDSLQNLNIEVECPDVKVVE